MQYASFAWRVCVCVILVLEDSLPYILCAIFQQSKNPLTLLTIATCIAFLSASLYTATVFTPSRWAVFITRHAISPRLAIRSLSNISTLLLLLLQRCLSQLWNIQSHFMIITTKDSDKQCDKIWNHVFSLSLTATRSMTTNLWLHLDADRLNNLCADMINQFSARFSGTSFFCFGFGLEGVNYGLIFNPFTSQLKVGIATRSQARQEACQVWPTALQRRPVEGRL